MGLIDKLQEANLDKDTRIELYMEEGEDVIHCNDDYRHNVVENSGLIEELATLTMHPANSKRFLLKEMRDEGLLDEYERGEFYFDEFVSDIINDSWYEYDWIETETEQYDYKRGFCTARIEFDTTVGDLIENMNDYSWSGWAGEVETGLGTLKIDNY